MLEGKKTIVTGAARGIGRAIALEFDEKGADVVVADIQREHMEGGEPTDELVDGEFVETDVTDPDSVRGLVDEVADERGLDVIVNNAGVGPAGQATDIEVDDWHGVIDVNLHGVFYCCKFALPHLLETDGCIVNISSVAGLQATEAGPAYSASKGGVVNLTRQLALDYAAEDVRINAIAPGPVETQLLVPAGASEEKQEEKMNQIRDMMPDRMGQPDDIAKGAVFLASDLADFVNGHNLVIDGALTAKYY
jgi:meso-butanediol dehydrogenase/(S,S)-butanediol dehydrogenase/diacetyl reductase